MSKGKLMLHCPKGHSIPHRTPHGECTPMYCAVTNAPVAGKTKANQKVLQTERKRQIANKKTSFQIKRELAIEKATKDLELEVLRTPLQIPDGANSMLVNEGRLEVLAQGSANLGKHRARLSFIKDMPVADADEVTINNWTDKRTLQLLPIAVAEKEYQLRFGDDGQRERAADAVLKMTGRYQKEGALAGGASIVLMVGPGGMQLPYMPKRIIDGSASSEQVIDGKVVLPEGELVRAKKLP